MSSRTVVVAAAALLLQACMTYQPKPGQSTARLRLASYTSDNTDLSVNDMSLCPERKRLIYTQVSGLSFGSSAKLGMLGSAEAEAKDSTELIIPANQRLPLVVGSSVGAVQYVPGYSCSVGVAFDTKADAQYEVQYRYENRACSVRLFELVQPEPGKVERVHVQGASSFRGSVGMNQCPYK
jgi:hypothetical protein